MGSSLKWTVSGAVPFIGLAFMEKAGAWGWAETKMAILLVAVRPARSVTVTMGLKAPSSVWVYSQSTRETCEVSPDPWTV